eukprot:GHRR01008633.1.p1 GENE.GHRR01008633.1~~GHRR01008633.1.p1  ORF type:complete len:157 (+),score=11.50 GHRR01008633.1:444-914(+)
MAESWDPKTRQTVQKIPLLTENAGPRDAKEKWDARLKQELQALITYIQMNKESDTDWFTIQPEDGGKSWKGKCCCTRDRDTGARRQDSKNVSRRQDMLDNTLQAPVGKEQSPLWICPCPMPRPGSLVSCRNTIFSRGRRNSGEGVTFLKYRTVVQL